MMIMLAWIMKRTIGFLGSYTEGLAPRYYVQHPIFVMRSWSRRLWEPIPSRIPPCGGALFALLCEAGAELVTVAIAAGLRARGG